MESIIALDPGTTTGVCFGVKRNEEEVLYVAPYEQAYSLQELYLLLQDFLGIHSADHANIIYEDFQYRNYARAGLDLTPVKMIGIIELFIERHEPIILATKQSPSTGKSFYKDDELKRIGCYKVGMQHGRDATRHLLQWANFGAGGQYFDHANLQYQMLEVDAIYKKMQW
jgi:hypothetical protein